MVQFALWQKGGKNAAPGNGQLQPYNLKKRSYCYRNLRSPAQFEAKV